MKTSFNIFSALYDGRMKRISLHLHLLTQEFDGKKLKLFSLGSACIFRAHLRSARLRRA